MHLGAFGVWSEQTLCELDVGADGTLGGLGLARRAPGQLAGHRPAATQLLIRQYQVDWEVDRVATFHLERLDTPRDPAPGRSTEEGVGGALDRAAAWVEASVTLLDGLRGGRPGGHGPQRLRPAQHPAGRRPQHRLRRRVVGAGARRGAGHHPRRARRRLLGLDRPPPLAHGLRGLRRPPDQHQRGAGPRRRRRPGPPGPGRTPTRARPTGSTPRPEPEGLLVYRYVGTRTRPVPEAEVVPVAAVADHLPDDHPRVTPESAGSSWPPAAAPSWPATVTELLRGSRRA